MDQVIKALIVDDSKTQCEILEQQLLHFGISVVDYCHDGKAALDIIVESKTTFDAIFVDLHMHGMDGLELIHQLDRIHYRGGVVIVSALEQRIIEYTKEVISNYNIRLLGSIEKPIERSIVAFMVRRIKFGKHAGLAQKNLPKRRAVRSALENDLLQVYFQPIVDGDNNEVRALECLSRMELEGGQRLSPNEFMPVIEKFDLWDIFTEKLFSIAGPAYRKICEETGNNCVLNINLSPNQLFSDDLPSMLAEHVTAHEISKESVCFEITENYSLSEDLQQKNLSRLRIYGFKLSLDDYGTGYTNLHQITNMPFNNIKLDAELINGMHKDKLLTVIVESVFKISEELGLDLIAEGISNPHDLIMLDEIGIHLFQGYFFARPKPAEEYIRWHSNWRKAMEDSKEFDKHIIERGKH